MFVCLFVVHHCSVLRAKHQKSKSNFSLRFSQGPCLVQHVGRKFRKLWIFAFLLSSSSVPPGCQLPCLLETIDSKQTVRHVAPSFLCVCVWFFFTPNSGNEEESCTPLTFCPPRDDNCTRSGAGKKKPERDFSTASASTQRCAPIRGAFNLLQTPSAVPARPASPPPERKQTTPLLQLGASRQDGSYNDCAFFLLIQSQTDVHVSANQSITDPVHSLFRM